MAHTPDQPKIEPQQQSVIDRGSSIPWWTGLQGQVDKYELIICDLWGVIHNGLELNLAAVDAIRSARQRGIKTVFLTNAPRPRDYVRDQLRGLGLDESLLDHVVTSGGLARDTVRDQFAGAKLYHMGPAKDHGTVKGLPVEMVDTLEEAEVIFATDRDFDPIDGYRSILRPLAEKQIPFLCANPDKIVHVGERLQHCAGAVADIYEGLGGPVTWFGKPIPMAYEASMREGGFDPDTDKDKVLMIGDSVRTDITGAVATGIDSLMLTRGIHRDALGTHANAVSRDAFLESVAPHTACPTALTDQLRWL